MGIDDEARMAEAAIHLVTGSHALTEAGRLVEAEGIAQFGFDGALNERIPLGVGWFGLELGRVQLLRGAASQSLTSFRAAANGFAEIGLRPQVWWACGGAVFAAATTGEPAELAIALDALDACERDSVAFMRPDVLRARANAAALRGLPSEADDYLSEALDLARATEQHTLAYGALHDLARLGHAPRAAALLDAYPVTPDGVFAPARARYIRATAARDGRELAAVAVDFEALNALLYAAEAAASAARLLRESGANRPATEAAAMARRLIGACETARTPPLASRRARRRVDAPRARCRVAGIGRRDQSRDRRTLGHLGTHGRESSATRVQQARRRQPRRARRRVGVREHSLGLRRAVVVGDERLPAEARWYPVVPVRAVAPAPAGRHDRADDGLPARGPRGIATKRFASSACVPACCGRRGDCAIASTRSRAKCGRMSCSSTR